MGAVEQVLDIFAVFIDMPLLALAPALFFALLFAAWRRRALLVGAGTWLVYFLYEEGMRHRILCSGECNIRLDLLLVCPALIVFSVAALLSLRSRQEPGS